ncbi:DEAD/DEAH box helicase [Mangrovimonas aestuarii]|uniref:DEAD/DEAH box helicase n=1 Tax=Mangrovimonas aestuarii TaxID=3018443 RepID=UPI002378B816|nr:DEAD/DEAH box helicase [Mangrovimonas aestuarii]
MASVIKNQQEVLNKLGIPKLNPMQEEALAAIGFNTNTVILSPTGTGKTLAFLMPLLELLDPGIEGIQALVLVPSRELAIQIEQVARDMGSGYKINAVYGGRDIYKDRTDLKHPPAILIGTPGRIADHFRQERLSTDNIETLVLDEFDKALETGFEKEMKEIIKACSNITTRILTSATQGVSIPNFVQAEQAITIDYLNSGVSKLVIKSVVSPTRDKQHTLIKLLNYIGDKPGIIFCNLKDSIQVVSDFLKEQNVEHECFYGGMEQRDRERSLIKFRNGSCQLIVATDLAARGLDIPELQFIIHYELPFKKEEFIHRNGRTARVHAEGTAYVLKWAEKPLPHFIEEAPEITPTQGGKRQAPYWKTLLISGGRQDKISKGDVAGLFFKQGNLGKEELGVIELKQDCTFVAVPAIKAVALTGQLNNTRLKKKKVRITLV